MSAKCKNRLLPMSYDEKICPVQTQFCWDFHWIQLALCIFAWKSIPGKKKDVLKQAQELFCFRALVVGSYPRSEPKTAKKPFFLKSLLRKVTFDTWKRLPTWSRWYLLIIFDTELTLGCFASGAGAQQVVSSLSGICTYTLLRLVHIIGGLL